MIVINFVGPRQTHFQFQTALEANSPRTNGLEKKNSTARIFEGRPAVCGRCCCRKRLITQNYSQSIQMACGGIRLGPVGQSTAYNICW